MAAKVRVAVAGMGVQGRRHLEALLKRPDVAVVGICDVSDRALREAPGGIRRFTTIQNLLNEVPRVDGAVLALPHHAHAESFTECALAGVHVLKEKPLARSREEAQQFV